MSVFAYDQSKKRIRLLIRAWLRAGNGRQHGVFKCRTEHRRRAERVRKAAAKSC